MVLLLPIHITLESFMRLVHNLAVLYLSTLCGRWHHCTLEIAQLNCKRYMCSYVPLWVSCSICSFDNTGCYSQPSNISMLCSAIKIAQSIGFVVALVKKQRVSVDHNVIIWIMTHTVSNWKYTPFNPVEFCKRYCWRCRTWLLLASRLMSRNLKSQKKTKKKLKNSNST